MRYFAFPEGNALHGRSLTLPPYGYVVDHGVVTVLEAHARSVGRILVHSFGAVEVPGPEAVPYVPTREELVAAGYQVPPVEPLAEPLADTPVVIASPPLETTDPVAPALVASSALPPAPERTAITDPVIPVVPTADADLVAQARALITSTVAHALEAIAGVTDVRIIRAALVAEQQGRKRASVLDALAKRTQALTPARGGLTPAV